MNDFPLRSRTTGSALPRVTRKVINATTVGERTGFGFLGNEAASGTEIIERLGDEHVASGKLIVYTSADSVFQVAAHEDVLPLDGLYAFCKEARAMLQGELGVSRVIARPFAGLSGSYRRTSGRRDFSLPPPGETLLDRLRAAELPVAGIGKVKDLFAGRGFSLHLPSKSNAEGMERLAEVQAESSGPGLVMLNLVDFDMLWGHRRDPEGYAEGLLAFDRALAEFLGSLRPADYVVITADHGNDPTGPGSDHTREYVPLLVAHRGLERAVDLGRRPGFGDLAETLAEAYGLAPFGVGESFWPRLQATDEQRLDLPGHLPVVTLHELDLPLQLLGLAAQIGDAGIARQHRRRHVARGDGDRDGERQPRPPAPRRRGDVHVHEYLSHLGPPYGGTRWPGNFWEGPTGEPTRARQASEISRRGSSHRGLDGGRARRQRTSRRSSSAPVTSS